jgi:hypothetical protein
VEALPATAGVVSGARSGHFAGYAFSSSRRCAIGASSLSRERERLGVRADHREQAREPESFWTPRPLRAPIAFPVRARLTALLLFFCAPALAQDRGLPVPPGTLSLEVVAAGATVRAAPSVHAPRRGTVRIGTRLPFVRRVRGTGCPGGEWYELGSEQYVCESLVRESADDPAGDALPVLAPGALLPRSYAFVSTDGTWAYSRPSDYFSDEFVESLGRGFGVAVVERRSVEGVDFVRSLSGLWIPDDDVRYAHGSEFAGVELRDGTLDLGWVVHRGASVRAWDGRRVGSRVVRRAGAREVVHVLEELPHGMLRIEDGAIAARDVQRPTLSPPPPEVSGDALWIDIEIATQTLVAYEGARPVFATLVSTGRPGAAHTTPVGTFHVWVKLAEDTMDDLQQLDQETNYAIEGVPWVQYFSHGIALHTAFWHDDFGRRHSHGCVNLSPRDARRLFALTEPQLPAGWDAILTTDTQPGSVVRVR